MPQQGTGLLHAPLLHQRADPGGAHRAAVLLHRGLHHGLDAPGGAEAGQILRGARAPLSKRKLKPQHTRLARHTPASTFSTNSSAVMPRISPKGSIQQYRTPISCRSWHLPGLGHQGAGALPLLQKIRLEGEHRGGQPPGKRGGDDPFMAGVQPVEAPQGHGPWFPSGG